MPITRLGFTGVQAAYASPFADKAAAAGGGGSGTQRPRASRYRYEYRVNTVTRLWWLLAALALRTV